MTPSDVEAGVNAAPATSKYASTDVLLVSKRKLVAAAVFLVILLGSLRFQVKAIHGLQQASPAAVSSSNEPVERDYTTSDGPESTETGSRLASLEKQADSLSEAVYTAYKKSRHIGKTHERESQTMPSPPLEPELPVSESTHLPTSTPTSAPTTAPTTAPTSAPTAAQTAQMAMPEVSMPTAVRSCSELCDKLGPWIKKGVDLLALLRM